MPTEAVSQVIEESAVGERPPRRSHHWALNLLGVGLVFVLCYYAEVVLVVMLVSILLAFILAPAVDLLMRARIPRGLAAVIVLLLLSAVIIGVVYYSYNQAASLLQDVPKYTSKIRDQVLRVRKQAESFQVFAPEREKGVLSVRPATDWGSLLSRGFGSVGQAMFAASFVPFLVFFMLTWQHHVRSATVMLFPMQNRQTAYVTLGLISSMIRSFMVGNVLIGLLIGTVSTVIFWVLGVPFFYLAGYASGFLSLVPYLGLVLAMAPPILVSAGRLPSETVVTLVAIVWGLHLIALNILYPKFLGNRLQLNPLAVTMALLLWAWLWGGVGLLLAIPITAATKIIFDHVESLRPYGAWLGE